MIASLLLAAALAASPAGAPPAAAAPASPAAAPAGPRRVLNRVAGLVNGEVITLHEVEERAAPELRRLPSQPEGPVRDRARARILRQAFEALVAERLFSGQVAALGVEINDTEIDSVIEDVKKRNNLDDARLDEALASQGMDRPAYRKAVKRDLESMRILQVKIRSKVKVSDEDVRVRHIFLALTPQAGPAEVTRVKERADHVLARVRRGEEFGQVARQASEGPSASDGGELGWLRRGTVQADVEKVAFGLQPGQISEPVRTRAGFQILKLEDRRGGGPKPLDEVKEEIRDRLVNEQGDAYRTQFITELKKDAVIDVKMPELKEDKS